MSSAGHIPASLQLAAEMPFPERMDGREGRLDRFLLNHWATAVRPAVSSLLCRRASRIAARLELLERSIATLTDEGLRRAADDIRQSSARPGGDRMERAFALAREAAGRHRGMRHFPVQLLGAAVMMNGAVAEMQTGEGKTLTAVLPAVAAALSGRKVHVITVNDYLAQRDATDLAPVYRALGLTVGLVAPGQPAAVRQRAYQCDVTYATNKELVFDYLRDRLALGQRHSRRSYLVDQLLLNGARLNASPLVLRGLQFAIVDEADSILIDEARTPLILSGSTSGTSEEEEVYHLALEFAGRLKKGEDFSVIEDARQVRLTEAGQGKVASAVSRHGGIWEIRRAREELVRQAVSAVNFFHRDTQYVVADGKVQIVDDFTGRLMPDRSWEHGLHQMIEAKEGCEITGRKVTLESITYQRFFRRYQHLCGMTGTASEVAGELNAVYGLKVARIPTNRPSKRTDHGIMVYATTGEKWRAVVRAAGTIVDAGRAVLIGTRSIEASEHLSRILQEAGRQHVTLNAKLDGQEANIVASAGQPGRITVATNMAGRGTDIKLAPLVLENGGLHVILTEFHESRRIDRQLFGRAGRQGDPGSCEAIVALDDELFRRFCPDASVAAARSLVRLSRAAAPSVGRALRVIGQGNAERTHGAARRAALAASRRADEMLGFSGKA